MIHPAWFILIYSGIYTMPTQKSPSLKTYRSKRRFSETPEPYGKKKKSSKKLLFVIQHHIASHDHYDFRIQVKGTMPSWALPKGPSLNPADKRLAVKTEDHPIEYAYFEGIIPPGNYGAGTVMVWDIGTYEPIKMDKDRIELFLNGKKLQGRFALIKASYLGGGSEKNWLFIKMNDEYASKKKNPVKSQTKSVLTNRTMAQIKKAKESFYGCH